MRIEILNENLESKYGEFLLKSEKTLLYASLEYRNLLKKFLGCKDYYLIALSDDGIKGVMPLFVKESGKYGAVFNSLPFYGSNGGVIADDGDYEVKGALLKHYQELLNDKKAAAGTLITSPFDADQSFYDEKTRYQFKDKRVGQVTIFPETADGLMDLFHQKTRNAIRKGMKTDVTVDWKHGLDYLDFLFVTHKENMSSVGVLFKPKSFFDLLASNFEYGRDFRIYVAFINGEPVAGLLNFYFNKTVEYFTPAVVSTYREYQPTSVIIYEAMKDALGNGYKYWNWGGSSASQKGVYDFKKRWGTKDFDYYYYTSIADENLKHLTANILLEEFRYFYVLPFSVLQSQERNSIL